jgi:tripartite-type tricarboxylate transporter receptor subunit TctC
MNRIHLSRRRGLLALALAPVLGGAWAQEPRTVRLVVPAPAGGTLDVSARLFARRMAAHSGEPWLVENRPGANSQIAAEWVARAPADGRVLMFAGSGLAFMPWLQKVDFSPLDELAPVVQLTTENFVLVTGAGSSVADATSIEPLARQAGLTCVAPPGPPSIACEQLRARWGERFVSAPYPGVAPAITALLGGHADLMFTNLESGAKLAAAGRVRLLARSSGAPGLPGVPEFGVVWPGLELDSHFGILAPRRTPRERIDALNAQFNLVLVEPEVLAALTRDGAQQPVGGSPQRYAAALRSTAERYGALIEKLGLSRK